MGGTYVPQQQQNVQVLIHESRRLAASGFCSRSAVHWNG